MNDRKTVLQKCLCSSISKIISKLPDESVNALEEIRIRTGRGVLFKGCSAVCRVIPDSEDMKDMLMRMSDFSLYAHLEQLRQGFVTLKGGHRVGICGKAVTENNRIDNITEISSICIRLASQIKGAANSICDIAEKHNLLIISPPGCGKTTLLRDLARILGNDYNISLIDERCEIAACVDGVPQLDVGVKTDVLSCCMKTSAVPLLIRCMSPDIIMTDELSGGEDIDCITKACSMGVKVTATVHGSCLEDVKRRMNTDIFEKFIILDRNKRISEVV